MRTHRINLVTGFLLPASGQGGAKGHLLGRVRVVVDKERQQQLVSGCDSGFRWEEILDVLNIVGGAETMVERPWPTQFQRNALMTLRLVATRADISDGCNSNSLKYIACRRTSNQGFAEDQSDRHLGKFF